MLNFLRENQTNFAVKILLGLIILSFAAFFGASSIDPGADVINNVALVNDTVISRQKHDYYTAVAKQQFDDYVKSLPPQFQSMLKRTDEQHQANALEQLINQALLREQIQSMGIKTPKEELVEAIRSNPSFKKDGKFDYEFYQDRYLPGYRLQTGTHFENELSMDLASSRLFSLFDNLYPLTESEKSFIAMINQATFEFQVITIPKTQKTSKTVKDENGKETTKMVDDESYNAEELAKSLHQKLQKGKLSDKDIKQSGAREHKSGKIKYKDFFRLLRTKDDPKLANLKAAATLEKKNSFTDILEQEDSYLIVKLLNKTDPFADKDKASEIIASAEEQANESFQQEIQSAFISNLRENADIEQYADFTPKQPAPAQNKPTGKTNTVQLPAPKPAK